MPNRILRDITDSRPVNKLSVNAEVLMYRLFMKADDFGTFHSDTELIKANCFPLKLNSVREADISRWMDELQKAGLIVIYEVSNKSYLRITNFNQRLRRMVNRFPDPPAIDNQVRPIAAECGQVLPESESESESETETEGEGENEKSDTPPQNKVLFKKFNEWVTKNAPRVNQLKNPLTLDQYLKLRDKIPRDTLKKILLNMHNKADLHKKYISAYHTIQNWSKNEWNTEIKNEHGISATEKIKSHFSKQE